MVILQPNGGLYSGCTFSSAGIEVSAISHVGHCSSDPRNGFDGCSISTVLGVSDNFSIRDRRRLNRRKKMRAPKKMMAATAILTPIPTLAAVERPPIEFDVTADCDVMDVDVDVAVEADLEEVIDAKSPARYRIGMPNALAAPPVEVEVTQPTPTVVASYTKVRVDGM